MDLEQQIAKLKELQADLEKYEATQKRINNYEQQLRQTQTSTYNNTNISDPYKTNCAQKKENEYKTSKQAKKKTFTRIYAIVSIVVILALAAFWMTKYEFFFFTRDYLYTPEIIKTYHGTYTYNDFRSIIWNQTLTITSCDKTGNIEGTYEYSYEDEVLGKFEFEGKVQEKSPNNSVYVSIHRTNWIVEGKKPAPFDNRLYMYITDNYSVIHSVDGNTSYSAPTDLIFYDNLSKENEIVTNLETPEIVGSYAGYYSHGGNYYSKMTIDSCDASGNITGIFEADLGNPNITDKEKEDDYTKYNITGKILQKYASGRVIAEINQGEILEQTRQPKTIPTMVVEIFDQYNIVKCHDYEIEWVNEAQYSERTPLNGTEKTVQIISGLCIFLILPIGLLIAAIMINKRIGALSKQEAEDVAKLKARDRANEQANNQYRSEQINKAQSQARANALYLQGELVKLNGELQKIQTKIAKNDILPDSHKKLNTVYGVIRKLEAKQDPVKEALYAYQDEQGKIALDNFNKKMDALEAKWQREKEADALESHRLKVEAAQREQAEHLKKIREMLEK